MQPSKYICMDHFDPDASVGEIWEFSCCREAFIDATPRPSTGVFSCMYAQGRLTRSASLNVDSGPVWQLVRSPEIGDADLVSCGYVPLRRILPAGRWLISGCRKNGWQHCAPKPMKYTTLFAIGNATHGELCRILIGLIQTPHQNLELFTLYVQARWTQSL